MSSLFQGTANSGKVLMAEVADPDVAIPAGFFRGLAIDGVGAFLYSLTDSASPQYMTGLRVSPIGVLIADDNKVNFDHYGPGAAPQSANDFLIIDTINPEITAWQGVPYAGDAIVVDDTGTFTAFNGGFSDGFG